MTTSDEPRDWDTLREAAVAAVAELIGEIGAEGVADNPAAAADTVLAVCDEEAVNRMTETYMEEYRLRSLDFRNGMAMDLEPSKAMVAHWVGAARGMIGDATNYVEMEVSLAGEAEVYVFRLERKEGKTPHQLRREAEAKLEAAETRVAELDEQLRLLGA